MPDAGASRPQPGIVRVLPGIAQQPASARPVAPPLPTGLAVQWLVRGRFACLFLPVQNRLSLGRYGSEQRTGLMSTEQAYMVNQLCIMFARVRVDRSDCKHSFSLLSLTTTALCDRVVRRAPRPARPAARATSAASCCARRTARAWWTPARGPAGSWPPWASPPTTSDGALS